MLKRRREEEDEAWQREIGPFKNSRVWLTPLACFEYYVLCLLYLQVNTLAQMVGEKAFDAHVLGSIPGVCILLFS